ncbi:ABC transporter permease [Sphingosinicella sp.]|uniref:ABC transporter permease n=1 Tax=Sphingosinicella sp. TaxID=1917971 RepID=UPI0035ADEB63
MKDDGWRNLLRKNNFIIGGSLLGIVMLAALAGAIATPYDPIDIDAANLLAAPSLAHWLGTDEWGRDVVSRLLKGAGTSVSIGLMTAVAATLSGALLGATSAYLGGWLDRIVIAAMDALLAFPSLIMALAVVAVFSNSQYAVVLALSVAYAPSVVRVVRSAVLAMKRKDFVDASLVMGNSRAFTLYRHILPNTIATVIVLATSLFGWALLAESSLSFLGLGVPPPAPSWGGMLADSRHYFEDAPWLAIAPGLAISFSLLGTNLLGDALRDHFDPRMRNL